ncbi:MAG: hypothetical protein Fur0021_15220 [Candidatus Promineifilaceae bacterium]
MAVVGWGAVNFEWGGGSQLATAAVIKGQANSLSYTSPRLRVNLFWQETTTDHSPPTTIFAGALANI